MNLESRQEGEEVQVDVDRQEQGEREDEQQEETSLEHQFFLQTIIL